MELLGSDMLKLLWDKWEIRAFMLASLSLQVVLTLLTPWRKRTGNVIVISMIWVVYLLADWVATATVGKIFSKQIKGWGLYENSDIATLWAPFLLLHSGGPDTISSFSVQDNELWPRHLCRLVLQSVAALYVFFKLLPTDKLLLLSTLLMLIAGTVRYAERIRALYAASLDGLGYSIFRKPDPGVDNSKFKKTNSFKLSCMPTQVATIVPHRSNYSPRAPNDHAGPDDEILTARAVLLNGYNYFKTFKGLLVGYVFTTEERQLSRNFFRKQNAVRAFQLAEVELSFLFEILHTKTFVLQYKWGWILRLISYCSILSAFASFYTVEKDGFRKADVTITYFLFSGAVSLDVISLITLLFSDRTAIAIESKWYNPILKMMNKRKRWSGKMSQCNLIGFCLHKESHLLNKIAELVRMRDRLDRIRLSFWRQNYVVDNELKEFIFKELVKRPSVATDVDTASNISSLEAVIDRNDDWYSRIVEAPYIESILLLHVATTLCCWEKEADKNDIKRNICKALSDYAFYLLVLQPNMISAFSSNWHWTFQDTSEEAKRLFRTKELKDLESICDKFLDVNAPATPANVNRSSRSVLYAACSLAKCLKKHGQGRWEIMGGVWVELLSFAANRCKVDVSAEQPSKGGELLTIVWFLLNHLGLGSNSTWMVELGSRFW